MWNERSVNRFLVIILAVSPLLLFYQNFSSHDMKSQGLPGCEPQIETSTGQYVFVCEERSFPSEQAKLESGRQPKYRIYLPTGFDVRNQERHPVVVHIETSTFAPPKLVSKEDFPKALAATGYIVAAIEPSGMNFKWTEESNPVQDIAAFMRLISNPSISAQYRIDPSQISLSGSDLGGYLALLEATRGEFRYSGLVAAHAMVRPENIFVNPAGKNQQSPSTHLQSVLSNWFGQDAVQQSSFSYSPFKRMINLRVKNLGFVVHPKNASDPEARMLSHDLKEFSAVAAVMGKKFGLREGFPSTHKEQIEFWKEHYIEISPSLKSLHMAGN